MKTINFNGVIGWDIELNQVQNFLTEANGDAITVNFSSPGGYVFEAFDIFNAINDYSGETNIVCGAMAISCGSFIPLAFDNISVHKNTMFMAHKVAGGIFGNADEWQNGIELMKGMEGIVNDYYAKRNLGIDLSILGNKEHWVIGGDKLKDSNFADSVIDEDSEDAENFKDKSSAVVAYNAANEKIKAKFEKEDLSNRLKNLKDSKKEIINNNEKENVNMDLATLKNKHPELYQEVLNIGVDQENERVSALLMFIDSSPKEVKDAIDAKTPINKKLEMTLMRADAKKNFADEKLGNITDENPGKTETPEDVPEVPGEDDIPEVDPKKKAIEDKLMEKWGTV